MARKFVERSGKDRRQTEGRVSFPLRLGNGEVVLRDRRVTPDRRQAVETQEIEVSREDFDVLFKAYNNH